VARGAADYFSLPDDLEVLHSVTDSILERQRERRRRDATTLSEIKPEAFSGIIGESPALKAVLNRAARLLPHSDATALVVGATGTGKELLARAIHDGGPRRRAPFVAVNTSALPPNLIESELFGHEKGAFTDAHAAKPGLFEIAEGGTLFLDEIGSLQLDLQAKLLRVLEDKMVRRVGGTKWRHADVRILAATNEMLEESVRTGSFRQDLYYRLSVVTLELPALRERGEDVVLIAKQLLERTASQYGLEVPPLDAPARTALQAHHWAGNVRELKNAIERTLLLSAPGQLDLSELIPKSAAAATADQFLPFPARLDDIVSAAARAMLEECDGNRSEAARRLGISRRRLRRLLGLGEEGGADRRDETPQSAAN
jgi:two-component system response regulator HydG